ncbi:hypothetical protein DID88_003199 [Monilinia fructigena]|uniref:Uncharacterized protein n=1 Tax=Monilinia fructigena TaxID=38457 RepID=A0A395IV36_9HELO|nr:hypothetical protein DID88_003199 [Monilinia fructigena]
MEPSSKKRRLAPKVPDQSTQEQSPQARYDYKAMPNLQEPAPSNERSDFESFARHLQDAAMLIYAQANRSPYKGRNSIRMKTLQNLSGGIKYLLEDAQPDVLLLLDSCATTDSSVAGSQGIKQGIAAYSPDQATREPGTRSFTYHLSEALNKLGTGRPFSTQRLHEEIISQKHNGFLAHTGLTNGAGKAASANERMPELEDGKILLEAREAAASTPLMTRHDPVQQEPTRQPEIVHQTPSRQDPLRQDPINSTPQSILKYYILNTGAANLPEHTNDVETSVEMHEAAEQLKALSHVRHLSHDNLTPNDRNHSHITSEDSPGLRSGREESASSQDQGESGAEDQVYNSEFNSPASRPKPRRSSQKQGPKQDTRCSMCSHTPFQRFIFLAKAYRCSTYEAISMRFSFAGCASTSAPRTSGNATLLLNIFA